MLIPFVDLLRQHTERGRALGAFTCYNFETAIGVLQAATAQASSVILLISEKSFVGKDGPALTVALRAIAEQTSVPVCLQLDHVSDLKQIQVAFGLGVGAVMADGSRLSFDENIAFTREAVHIAHNYGGAVEAELGRVEGDEDIAIAAQAGALTDPAQAAHFVAQTGVACLAISIGNVHGVYRNPPQLDWQRLRTVREGISTPLSLHGASGLTDETIRQAIHLGITKINVNTELRTRYLEVAATYLPEMARGARLLELQRVISQALSEVVAAKLKVYSYEKV